MCESGTGSSDPFRDGLREQQFRGVGGSGGDRRESLSLDAALSTETDDKLAKRQVSLIFNMDVRVLMHPTSNMRMIVDQFGRVVNGELRKGDENYFARQIRILEYSYLITRFFGEPCT